MKDKDFKPTEELVAAARIAATPDEPAQDFWKEVEERLGEYAPEKAIEPRQLRE